MHLVSSASRQFVYTVEHMNYYTDVLRKYAVFGGRASRKQYWMFFLINNIIIAILWGICFALHNLVLYWLYLLVLFVPGIAVGVRRLHDTDHSGWWYLVGLIPLVGAIILIVLMVTDSTPGQNRFGPNPKGV